MVERRGDDYEELARGVRVKAYCKSSMNGV